MNLKCNIQNCWLRRAPAFRLGLLFILAWGGPWLMPAWAGQSGDFTYEITNETAVAITAYTGTGGHVIIPDTIENLPVTSVGKRAFFGSAGLKSVAMPNSVTHLGDAAFSSCKFLSNVAFSAHLQALPVSAFESCSNLARVDIPGEVTRIGQKAFRQCVSLETVHFPASVTSIEKDAFNGCGILQNLFFAGNAPTLPAGATTIPANGIVHAYYHATASGWSSAFGGCATALWEEGFPFAYNAINTSACAIFRYLGTDAEVTIPDAIQGLKTVSLGASSFTFIYGVTNVVVPASVTNLETTAFSRCFDLQAVHFAGDAPAANKTFAFVDTTNAVIYYLPGTQGWEATFCGRPTALWRQSFADWAQACGLAAQYPTACGEQDDPDHDGLNNLQEMNAGTNPADSASNLAFESAPRPDHLTTADKTEIQADEFALYLQTVPGKSYSVSSWGELAGTWTPETQFSATTTQKRVVLKRPPGNTFYRAELTP